MAHFARINEQNIVEEVIVADQEFIDSGVVGDPNKWIQTSYNTQGGVHVSGGTPLRKNYAGIGYFYDSTRDAFIPPQPFPSWSLNENTCLWESPKPMPPLDIEKGVFFDWSEEQQDWIIRN